MKKLKFIEFDGDFKFSFVEFHFELLPKNTLTNDRRIMGGGEVIFDKDSKTITFTGRSCDFGRFRHDHLKDFIVSRKIFSSNLVYALMTLYNHNDFHSECLEDWNMKIKSEASEEIVYKAS